MINITKKEVIKSKPCIILPQRFGQKLLNIIGTDFCNTGIYGCNCNLYFFHGAVITHGNRPFGIKPDAELLELMQEYQSKIFNNETSFEFLRSSIKDYLECWCNTVLEMHRRGQ